MTLNIRTVLYAVLGIVVIGVAGYFLSSINRSSGTLANTTPSTGFVDGVHYVMLEPPVELPDDLTSGENISVMEFFWYGCPHCRAFEPEVKKWLESAPANVSFQQLPVVWNDLTKLHAAVFYIAQTSNNPQQLHDKLFDRIIDLRQERNPASQVQQIAELLAEYGIKRTTFDDLVSSTAIQASVDTAQGLMKQAQVSATPTVVVNGQWAVLNNEAVGEAGVFNVVDYLVQKAAANK